MVKDSDHLIGGDLLVDALEAAKAFDVSAVLLNCADLPKTVKAAEILGKTWPGFWGAYPNLGLGEPSVDGNISEFASNRDFRSAIFTLADAGASIKLNTTVYLSPGFESKKY